MRDTTIRHSAAALAAAILIAAALRVAVHMPVLWAWLFAINCITLAMYAYDKRQARRGGWRVPERALHLLAFVGGSPGALAAQQWLRHKTVKRSFQLVFWLICIAQVALLVWWVARRVG